MQTDDLVFLATKGRVAAIRKRDGVEEWSVQLAEGLRSGDFVTLLVDGPLLLAHTAGRLHCLDAATGKEHWRNDLPGMGYDTAMIAVAGGATPVPPAHHQREQEQQDAAAAGAAGA